MSPRKTKSLSKSPSKSASKSPKTRKKLPTKTIMKTARKSRRGGPHIPRINTTKSAAQTWKKLPDSERDIDELIENACSNIVKHNIVVVSMVWPNSAYKTPSVKSNAVHEGHTFFMYIRDRRLYVNDVSGSRKYNMKNKVKKNYNRLVDAVMECVQEKGLVDSDTNIEFVPVSTETWEAISKKLGDSFEGSCIEYTEIELEKLDINAIGA